MSHVRKQIRDDIVTTLTGLATTGSRVYRSRVYPVADNKLPGLLIYTSSEEIETASLRPPRTQMRALTVTVEMYVKAVSNFDTQVDTISQEVEEALAVDVTRGGLAKDTTPTSFEVEYSGDGDQPVAVGRLSVQVNYATLENDASAGV